MDKPILNEKEKQDLIKEWCQKIDVLNSYYTVEPRNDEEKLSNLYVELCVERFLAEGIDLSDWEIKDNPYGDEDVEEYSFVNFKQEIAVDFEIQKDDVYEGEGYIAVPMYDKVYKGGIRLIRKNTVTSAIQSFHDIEEWEI